MFTPTTFLVVRLKQDRFSSFYRLWRISSPQLWVGLKNLYFQDVYSTKRTHQQRWKAMTLDSVKVQISLVNVDLKKSVSHWPTKTKSKTRAVPAFFVVINKSLESVSQLQHVAPCRRQRLSCQNRPHTRISNNKKPSVGYTCPGKRSFMTSRFRLFTRPIVCQTCRSDDGWVHSPFQVVGSTFEDQCVSCITLKMVQDKYPRL